MADTESYTMTGIPDDKLEQMVVVVVVKNDTRYISHQVVSEGDGSNRLTVTIQTSPDEGVG